MRPSNLVEKVRNLLEKAANPLGQRPGLTEKAHDPVEKRQSYWVDIRDPAENPRLHRVAVFFYWNGRRLYLGNANNIDLSRNHNGSSS